MLWRNESSVIVGKHQNALGEIDIDYTERNGIPVIRRLSGGGTVFHDLGNINFTFMATGKDSKVVDFKKYTAPILKALIDMGLPAELSERNDIFIKGKKVSGNAEHAKNTKVLHHGTLLFSAELDMLKGALRVDESRYESRAVKSVRSPVTNIAEHLNDPMTIDTFIERVGDAVMAQHPGSRKYHLTEEDRHTIEALEREKYRTWDWNYGYSPKFNFARSMELASGSIASQVWVHKGRVAEINIEGTNVDPDAFMNLEENLIGVRHKKDELVAAIENSNFNLVSAKVLTENLLI